MGRLHYFHYRGKPRNLAIHCFCHSNQLYAKIMNVIYTIMAIVQTRWGLALPVDLRPVEDIHTQKLVRRLDSSVHFYRSYEPTVVILQREAVVYGLACWIQSSLVYWLFTLH